MIAPHPGPPHPAPKVPGTQLRKQVSVMHMIQGLTKLIHRQHAGHDAWCPRTDLTSTGCADADEQSPEKKKVKQPAAASPDAASAPELHAQPDVLTGDDQPGDTAAGRSHLKYERWSCNRSVLCSNFFSGEFSTSRLISSRSSNTWSFQVT